MNEDKQPSHRQLLLTVGSAAVFRTVIARVSLQRSPCCWVFRSASYASGVSKRLANGLCGLSPPPAPRSSRLCCSSLRYCGRYASKMKMKVSIERPSSGSSRLLLYFCLGSCLLCRVLIGLNQYIVFQLVLCLGRLWYGAPQYSTATYQLYD